MHKTLFLKPTTPTRVQCHVERLRDITLSISLFLPSFLPYCDLFLPTQCRRRGLLLHLITNKDRYTHTHTHIRYDSHGRVIGLSQITLITHNIHSRHSCARRDSNPQSQQASGHWDRHVYFSVNPNLKASFIIIQSPIFYIRFVT